MSLALPGSAITFLAGLDMDGLYRISGNLATIQKLRYKVDHGEVLPQSLPWELKAQVDADGLSLPPALSPPQMSAWTWTMGAGRTST